MKLKLFLLILLIICFTDTGVTKTHVSLNGNFYIIYPDSWEQVEYNTVNQYLIRSNAGRTMFDYDVVLAPSYSEPFFTNEYLILHVEKIKDFSSQQIDSVLKSLSQTFGEGIKYFPVADFMADLKSDAPNYDRNNKVVTILNEIVQNQQVVKKNLIMMKFYDDGIASFYFYSPDSLFEQSKKIFQNIVNSFSTENVEQMLPKENLKVADLKKSSDTGDDFSFGDSSRKTFILSIAVLVLFTVIIILRRKRKRN
ncbi:MAG: hypothetical protein ACE5D6_05590 [Candidatus Zixiibacteriota bacterium]